MIEPSTGTRDSRFVELAYTAVRVVAAYVYLQHGAQKLFGVLGGFGPTPGGTVTLASQMGLAGVIEFFGGLLILFGLATRVAAFVASGEMAAAYFLAHAPRGFLWTVLNRGELPAVFAFLFLYIALRGPGPYSLDALIRRTRGGPEPTLAADPRAGARAGSRA